MAEMQLSSYLQKVIPIWVAVMVGAGCLRPFFDHNVKLYEISKCDNDTVRMTTIYLQPTTTFWFPTYYDIVLSSLARKKYI